MVACTVYSRRPAPVVDSLWRLEVGKTNEKTKEIRRRRRELVAVVMLMMMRAKELVEWDERWILMSSLR